MDNSIMQNEPIEVTFRVNAVFKILDIPYLLSDLLVRVLKESS